MSPTGNFELLCLENPLLDIQGKGDEKMLEQYGLKPNDAILAEEKHMGLYEDLIQNRDAKLIAGGAAQNTARGAQYILPADSVLYIGCVGKDKYADILTKACADAGLRVEYRIDSDTPTGRCGVIITGHNRSMCTDLAAANCYKVDHLKSAPIWELVEKAKVYYVGGYHLTVSPEAIMALAEEAAAKDKTFMLSLSAPFICQFFIAPLNAAVPYCDYIIGNEAEAAAFAVAHGLKEDTPIPEIATFIAKLPKENSKKPRTVIITQGLLPTVVAIGKAGGEIETKEFPVHAIEESAINDTNGAGDAFAGGFVAGVVKGESLETSVDMGQWLAKLSIQELGPSYPSPKQTYSK
ncbi:putative adenosine kinase [Aulographum hederae CBS 113979]|uniref:Adenosine kinase n=1 Tax=Aulographum hederae CBS 113979 TaxID=1176131 RepID=A0A6G1H1H9_9PEZI|nr:putative adenosine kinase [Aulographum hederae CBS 113979]